MISSLTSKISSALKSSPQNGNDNSTHAGETEIFRNRFILGTVTITLSYFFVHDQRILNTFSIYLGIAILLWITQKRNLLPSNVRLTIGLLLESVMGFYLLKLDSAGLAFIYPMYLWTILGNGFRFGVKWLALASLFTSLSFALTIYTQPFWQQNLGLSISLLVALIVIPAYCSSLIKKLSQAKEKAEMANRAKSYFLASVSHELRTPLNAIIGYGTHLSEMNLSPSHLKMVNSSVSAGQYLLQLIEQLLQLGKSDTQNDKIEMEDFNVTDILVESRDILNIRAQEKGLDLILQSETNSYDHYNGPVKEIKNLILNITSNAIKFTEHGKIIIRSSVKDNNGKLSLLLSITDTGIGIDNKNISNIFEPFQQADNTIMERFGGTGLGLAICKQIIDALGGTISVDSEIGQGSVFKLSIPITPAEASHAEEVNANIMCTKIISLGKEKEDTLLQAQCSGQYFITHYDCSSVKSISDKISEIDLEEYDIALLDQSIVGDIDSSEAFWKPFQQSKTACVLMSDNENIDIHKINIQASFASILSPATSFNSFRQAMKIGSSFIDNSVLEQIYEDNEDVEAASIKSASAENNNNKNILVVDDNRTNRMVLESILLSDGFNVSLVNDGDEALQILEEKSFDVMLIDVNMPRLNGIEATKLWRHMEAGDGHLPIIGVTADATEETLEKCLNAGMDERITKPVEAKKLISKVRDYCNNIASSENKSSNHEAKTTCSIIDKVDETIIDLSRIDYLESIGNRDFVRLVIDSYCDETKDIIAQLHSEDGPCNLEAFRFATHALKSSANNIGAFKLSEICKKYESIIESEYLGNESHHIDALMSELKNAEKNIEILRAHYCETDNDLNSAING